MKPEPEEWSPFKTQSLAVEGGQEHEPKRRTIVNTSRMYALTAGMALAASMMASATATAPISHSSLLSLQAPSRVNSLLTREREPGDDRGKDRRHDDKGKDGKGHKFVGVIAREQQPKDDKGKHKKDIDGRGHKLAGTVAREKEPGDDRGKGRRHEDKGKDGKGHKVASTIAREQQPKDDRGKGKKDHDRAGHKLAEGIA